MYFVFEKTDLFPKAEKTNETFYITRTLRIMKLYLIRTWCQHNENSSQREDWFQHSLIQRPIVSYRRQ